MKRIRYSDADFTKRLAEVTAPSSLFDPGIEQRTRAILDVVKARGDAALLELTERFDGARLTADQLPVTQAELMSASLQADALDFLADAGNYAISLFVVGMALRYRAAAALAKGATMGIFGLRVLAVTGWHAWHETLPQAATMGIVGAAALAANAASFGLLWRHRGGDANMRSAWICTRNDVIGNLAVLFAAVGVFGTGTRWPDVIVACVMAAFALQGALVVVCQSSRELRAARRVVGVNGLIAGSRPLHDGHTTAHMIAII